VLTIAVTGGVGSGKTTLLKALSEWCVSEGRAIDGFLAVAEGRVAGTPGAPAYELEMLGDGRRLPYAVRDDSIAPPYRFEESTTAHLHSWAAALQASRRLSVLFLDEFGPVEAGGKGHMLLWPAVRQAAPEIVIVAVRKGLEEAVGGRMGVAFDLFIDAAGHDAFDAVCRACAEQKDWTRVGLYGAGSGGFEASVGAVLHGAQVPLRGLFLSGIQSVIMTYAADGLGQRRRVVWVPFIAASLKALSPSGNRLRPMLAITIQGTLYTFSIVLCGWNILGAGVGGFLVGAWSAVQGVALQYLFVGSELIRAYDVVLHWVADRLQLSLPGMVTLFLAWSCLCGAVASTATLIAWKRRRHVPLRLQNLLVQGARRILPASSPPGLRNVLVNGLRDLSRPFFWFPVLLVVVIVLATGSPMESAMWIVVRAAGIGFVVFALVRLFDPGRFIRWLRRKGHWGPALAYQRALDRPEEQHHRSSKE
jgi:nucleoside-triphosphatase THEP1